SFATDVAFDPNGDIIAGGQLANAGTGRDFAVAKLNGSDGSVAWLRTFSGGNNADAERVNRLRVDASGDVVAAGWLPLAGGGRAFYVQKLHGDTGAEAWAEPYMISVPGHTGSARAVDIDGEGNLAVAGFAFAGVTERGKVVKLDGATGSAIWEYALIGG